MTRYLIAAGVALLVVLGLYRWGYHNGWGTRDAEMQAEIARANEAARDTERRLAEQLSTTDTKLKEANDALDQKSSALDRAIRAGRVRLPSPSCVQAPAGAPAAPVHLETASQSDRQADEAAAAERATLLAIAQIVADGDRAINQLNACIDAYNQVMEQINGHNR